MACIWRRQPSGRLERADLVRSVPAGQPPGQEAVADDFWEAGTVLGSSFSQRISDDGLTGKADVWL